MQKFLDAITPAHLRPLDSPARWWLAVLAIPAAALLSAAVHRITGGVAAPFSPFYLAVIVAAALGGVGPGLLTLVLTVLFVLTLGATFFGPQWQLFATEPLTLAIFVAGGLVIVAITHQLQRSRAAARQVLARLEQLQADVGIRLWTVDLGSGALQASGQPLRLDGRTLPSADGRLARDVWLTRIHPDDRAGMLERLQRAIDAGESRYEYEVRVPQSDGSMRWINSYIHVHRDDDGRATHLSGAAVDVTPMRAARQAQAETELRLRDSEERLRLAMEGARMGTWFSDTRTGRVVWDDAHLRLLGYDPQSPPSPSDALWRERVHPEDLPRVQADLDEAHRSVAPFDLELRIRRADDGTERWLALYGRYLRDGEQGPAHQSIGVVFDITARKQAELELERQRVELQTMLDLIPVGVAVAHDPRAEHITLSPRLAAMLRVEQHSGAFGEPQQQDAAGTGMGLDTGADAMRPPVARRTTPYRCFRDGRGLTRDEMPMRLAALGGREVRNAEFDVVFDNGEVLHLMSSAAPLFDARGQVRGVIGAHVDVTSFKRVQAALEQADRRKDEFLATLAHELRNPLAPIRYSARLLRPEAAPGVIAQVRDTIERQSTQMARLLDDLLDVSRITRNVIELRREPIDLRQVVEDSVEVARPLIDAVQHRLVLSLPGKPVWVEADRTRLSQIVSNLLQNAAKYTDPGGRIEVSVEQRQQDEALLRVRDSGIGIAPEMRERVFEIFSQVRRPGDGTRSGLGIGLAIVRRLVELHGGRIEVDSAGLGQGAEFIVHLPLAPPQTGLPLNVVPLFGSGRRRLLVVDDNHDAADSLGAMLRLSGHAVQVAYDGASAMALAETARPDVIVLDLGMPQTSGYDVARWIRRQPWGSGVRLIALTGWGQNEDRRRTREAGFDLHLTKPVDPDQLVAVLAEQGEAGEQGAPAAGK